MTATDGVAVAAASDADASAKGRGGAGGGRPKPEKASLYDSYEKVYPRKSEGRFRRIKTAMNWVLLSIFFIGPWLRWDRGAGAPDQAILIDMPGRKAYFFAIEIWPQEVYYLTGILVLAAISLFFVTALLGRVWCGFACFQTVFTDIFVAIERAIEGDRSARQRLDRGRLTATKLRRKVAKNAAWLGVAALVGLGFTLYFGNAPTLLVDILTLQTGLAPYGTIAVVGGFCFLLAGYAREQVCIYMCPYARFQSAMMDDESLIVTYERWRGEPRGKARKTEDFSQRGHCVDCTLCVQVCPTGVDIRKGTQLACIGCGLCADACDSIMERFNLPTGLVRFDSVKNQAQRAKGQSVVVRWLRPRTLIYTAALTVAVAVMATALMTRSRLEVNIQAERSPLYVQLSDGSIRNGYTVKILNMERIDTPFVVTAEGLPDAQMNIIGYDTDPGQPTTATLPVTGDSVGSFRVYLSAPPDALEGEATPFTFRIENRATGEVTTQSANFNAPAS
ncbi:cytochrome c oxidase accessory protein CcoG [Roseospira marina]|uniref:Cytochrome c oxidase accessory protein CcoG n=1 Tax=Roseospira marina TaxID=140057 RepID=A0A5M6IBR4_9PROT|nr:cytochrome c oxidase accessory protein CcoG [Roseospira marina]KAA5605681.1 cytochrome c oxidase accessory protein CcoG [Roseospira marina]MBB4313239.1 cytochrome c oxidase accessory protein FixG [Roseospira marina]MBB5086020.1 cytochrome c oxidase accessory protein FixG [Roseospira marina]